MKAAIPERTGLIEFVTRVTKDRHYSDHQILAAIEEAESEMISKGIVAVGDICNNTLTLTQKSKGRIIYHNFIEASGLLDDMAEIRFQRAVSFSTLTNNKIYQAVQILLCLMLLILFLKNYGSGSYIFLE
jgi:hypothetical protein